MKILILGVTGMLGNSLFKYFCNLGFDVLGTTRSNISPHHFSERYYKRIIIGVNVKDFKTIEDVYINTSPNIVINCVGLIKQIDQGNNPLEAIPVNSLLPHLLADLCKKENSRLIHFSTDCVFSGKKGNYTELDIPDAKDIYGRSKLLGEVDYSPALTIRTSIIGHELNSNRSLISWFLSQNGEVKGFKNAIYSGFPTVEMACIVKKIITEQPNLTGLYHVASNPISKYNLLRIVKEIYKKSIDIVPSDDLIINRSLNAELFNKITGYISPSWEELVKKMYDFEHEGIINVC